MRAAEVTWRSRSTGWLPPFDTASVSDGSFKPLSAQGRISGAVLGSLPIGFFLLVAATSHRQLAPVYGSTAGVAMVSVGLAMELLAFMWIRRLLDLTV
jgi:tight adherence protein B